MTIIGLKTRPRDCYLCRFFECEPEKLNSLTMDLLLDRRSAQQVASFYNSDHIKVPRINRFSPPFIQRSGDFTEADVQYHFQHCSKSEVPDDYIFHPDKYEEDFHHK